MYIHIYKHPSINISHSPRWWRWWYSSRSSTVSIDIFFILHKTVVVLLLLETLLRLLGGSHVTGRRGRLGLAGGGSWGRVWLLGGLTLGSLRGFTVGGLGGFAHGRFTLGRLAHWRGRRRDCFCSGGWGHMSHLMMVLLLFFHFLLDLFPRRWRWHSSGSTHWMILPRLARFRHSGVNFGRWWRRWGNIPISVRYWRLVHVRFLYLLMLLLILLLLERTLSVRRVGGRWWGMH